MRTLYPLPKKKNLSNMPQYHKIAGPPGTGKTTALLNIVDDLLKKEVPANRILYTTFTRAGANEAKDRAQNAFSLSDDKLCFFRTLHSLCLRQLRSHKSILSPLDWITIGKTSGFFFSLRKKEGESLLTGTTKGDHILNVIAIARNFQITLEEAHRNYPDNHRYTLLELHYLNKLITEYKEAHDKLDYTDLLEIALRDNLTLDVDYAIGDEMQDLTPLQWKVFISLARKAQHIWLAGDDDQCLYEWAGASAELFIKAPGDLTVLDQSYRIAQKIPPLAESVVQRISNRLPKLYRPRDYQGTVELNVPLSSVDMSEGEWLVLVRNQTFAKDLAAYCTYKGWSFTTEIPLDGVSTKVLTATQAWNQLMEGAQLSGKELKALSAYLKKGVITFGYKQVWAAMHDDDYYDKDVLKKDFGLAGEGSWSMCLKLTGEDKSFLQSLEKQGTINDKPRIEISSIHGAKGRERDNVLLCVDQTTRTKTSQEENPDPEHRVWYVGVTRAKNRLVVLQPLTLNYYDIL